MKPHSSTSDSDSRRLRPWIFVLLGLIAAFYAATELAAMGFLKWLSKTDQRVREERAAAIHPAAGDPELLLVGNSLLEFGVDVPELTRALAGVYRPQRFMMEASSYLDWYYGLSRLFREEARPRVVVLMLSGRQLLGPSVAGDDFAHYLMDWRDVLHVAGEIGADHTQMTNLLAARISPFYGTRTHIRNRLLTAILPSFGEMTAHLHGPRADLVESEETRMLMLGRVARLDELCRQNGARLMVVVLPTNEEHDGSSLLQLAGQAAQVEVHVPADYGHYDLSDFRDGFHMSESGSKKFTAVLAAQLRASATR
jgi:hypothetical protein